MDYYEKKYKKYKFKYFNLLNQSGGGYTNLEFKKMLINTPNEVYIKDEGGKLLTDPMDKKYIPKNNAVLINTQVFNANVLFNHIID